MVRQVATRGWTMELFSLIINDLDCLCRGIWRALSLVDNRTPTFRRDRAEEQSERYLRPTTRTSAAKIAWSLAILLAAASAGIVVDWRAPGLGRYATDWLMRARGPLPAPDDIAIVAIDEASMARFGRFPWSRQVIARTIDTLAAAHPKVIALDVLFTDATTQEDDDNLARSIGRAGNVVVAAQLTDSPVHGGPSRWLPPLPAIERAAASVGHVNTIG